MRIKCPFCGDRVHSEFAYRGDAGPVRPPSAEKTGEKNGAAPDPASFIDYAYLRTNPMGLHKEYWQHTGGCRTWLVVERNVTTHAIAGVVAARDEGELGRSGAR